LGNTLFELSKIDEAEKSYRKAIEFEPDYAEAYYNLGNILNDKGDLVAAIDSYKQALNIQPDFDSAWTNVLFPLQAIKLQASSVEDHLPLLGEQVSCKYAQVAKSILSYHLNLGSSSTDSSINEVLSILSSADNIFIKNPKVSSSELITGLTLPKKITAMVHFGRSGTGLLHSLIDGHPEVSTLPSIYFSEFFDHFAWEKIIAGGWEEMADRFTTTYAVLFNASSAIKIASGGNKFIHNIGRKEGMTNVGTERNEVLSLDKKVFVKELKQLMNCHDQLDALTFFKLVHSAYEKVLHNHNEKNLIFYHIHNPDTNAQLNFLRLAPNTSWLMMVREPLQSCESWIMKNFRDNDYRKIANQIFQMLFEVDKAIFRNKNSIGVRLEDLKECPKETILALCGWLGIKEKDSLYQMTAQGKKWWGDPASPDFTKEGMNPFGKTSINRKLGSVFSKNDQFILRTLFYPFSVRFSYAEENLEQFKNDLLAIRPMLDKMFDFERKIAQHTKMNTEKFMKSGSYLYLRSGMIERWNTLNKFHTYSNMLTPLKIN
jgi:tetratricopeptide (TPR) repeat protein